MKSLIGEYFGQSSVFVGKKTKGGVGWRRSTPTVVIGQRQRGGGTRGGKRTGRIAHIISVNLGKGVKKAFWKVNKVASKSKVHNNDFHSLKFKREKNKVVRMGL